MRSVCLAAALSVLVACHRDPIVDPCVPDATIEVARSVLRLQTSTVLAPTSGTLAFHSDREGRHRLFAVDVASGQVRRLTGGSQHHDEQPAWSPDGTQLAFVSNQFDGRTFDIAVMSAAGSSVRRLTGFPTHEQHPAWAPDGRRVWFSGEQEGTQALFEVDLTSGDTSRLTPTPHRALMATDAPVGHTLALAIGSSCGLRVAHLDAQGLRPFSPVWLDAAEPQWAPDGSAVAYSVFDGAASYIALQRPDGRHVTILQLDGIRTIREPTWSPDSRWIAAAVSATTGFDADWDLVLLPGNGHGPAYRLTSGPRSDRAPAWKPR